MIDFSIEKFKQELNLTKNELFNEITNFTTNEDLKILKRHFSLDKSYDEELIDYLIVNEYVSKKDIQNLIDLEKDNIWNLLNCCPLDENKCQLLNEILEMFALDVYMGQKDRNHWNFIFEKYDNNIHLGPLYDYEYSFGRIDDNISYKNPLYNFCCTDDYEILYNIFPQFLDNLKFYEKLDLISIINEIGTELKLNLKNSDIEYYKSQEELSQKVLQKIINKR